MVFTALFIFQAQGFSGQMNLNSMWFFEKPASRMNDPTPMYQGTVVDHLIKIKTGFGGCHTSANWEPVIQDMGNKGWELACILETPETEFSGMTPRLLRRSTNTTARGAK